MTQYLNPHLVGLLLPEVGTSFRFRHAHIDGQLKEWLVNLQAPLLVVVVQREQRYFCWCHNCFHDSQAVDCLKMLFIKIVHHIGLEMIQISSTGCSVPLSKRRLEFRTQLSVSSAISTDRPTYQHFCPSEERETNTKSLHRRSDSIQATTPSLTVMVYEYMVNVLAACCVSDGSLV